MSTKLNQDYKDALKPASISLIILIIILIIGYQFPWLKNIKDISSYVPLHTFLETISIVVSVMTFGICWGIKIKDRASNFLIIATMFLGVALLDFLHVISFKGMPDFITASGREKGIYFWLAARSLSAFSLIILSLRPWSTFRFNNTRWIILFSVLTYVAIVTWIGLWHFQVFPRTFVEGVGLTKFKIYFEYLIFSVYILSIFFFYRRMNILRSYDVVSLFIASSIMAMSELFFTLYIEVSDIYNVVGHIYKVIAYAYVYKSIYLESITIPTARLIDSHKALEEEITERKKVQSELSQNEKLLSAILYTLPVGVFVKDIKNDFKYKIWNKFSENLFGISSEKLIGKTDFEIFNQENAQKQREYDLEACKRNEIIEIPEEITQNHNGKIILHTRKTIILDPLGKPLFLVGISDDITDIKLANDELHKALSARDEFLIMASHELKTPITSLKIRLQILQRQKNIDPNIADQLEIILTQTDRLTKLINTILDVSRIQSGKFSVDLSPMNLNQSIGDVLDQFTEEIKNSQCNISVDIPSITIVTWDKARIEQVITNLLSNAIKYAPASNITITVTQDQNTTTLAIKDTGPGIPQSKQQLLFKRFERVGAPLSVSGLGLGLYISKQIIEAMTGTIKVESQVGKGSTFIINIPNNPKISM